MKLFEFEEGSRRLDTVVAALSSALGGLERVGGNRRVYQVGNQNAAVFLIRGSAVGIGLAWPRNTKEVCSIYMWQHFDVTTSPDYAIDIPAFGEFKELVKPIVGLLKQPKTGKIEVTLGESVITEEPRPDAAFLQGAKQMFGAGANRVSTGDLVKLAHHLKMPVPPSIAQFRVDNDHFDLSSGAEAPKAKVVDGPTADNRNFDDALVLAKAKTASALASGGHLVLYGRNPDGTLFEVPGFDDYAAKLERLLSNQIKAGGADRQTMEEQYKDLVTRVNLIASGKSQFIKSLLITGAPSSGKSFNVMEEIKRLGLTEGKDYIVKKGKISTVSMYRTLIEQIDGLVIFDDCDSVVADKDAVNILKGALDTDPVREISYDVRGTFNTAVMPREDRIKFVDAMSRVLRGVPVKGDIEMFAPYIKNMPEDDAVEDDDMDAMFAQARGMPSQNRLAHVQDYLSKHLPNKIDYHGRIIFVSNMEPTEWDGAIITRAFTINMAFTSGEMLDFIEKILPHLGKEAAVQLPLEQKKEVVDYIRELFVAGKLKKAINFRLVQQAFDLRLTSNWKSMVAAL